MKSCGIIFIIFTVLYEVIKYEFQKLVGGKAV